MENLMLTIEVSIKRQEIIFKDFPKKIEVKLLHGFEDKTKGFIIGGLVLFALSAVSTAMCFYLWNDNGRKDNDIKFRMVRQINPKLSYIADTLYYQNPEGMEKKTKKLEAQQLAMAQAEAAAKEVAIEAAKAKRLRKKRGKI